MKSASHRAPRGSGPARSRHGYVPLGGARARGCVCVCGLPCTLSTHVHANQCRCAIKSAVSQKARGSGSTRLRLARRLAIDGSFFRSSIARRCASKPAPHRATTRSGRTAREKEVPDGTVVSLRSRPPPRGQEEPPPIDRKRREGRGSPRGGGTYFSCPESSSSNTNGEALRRERW